ncbi:TOBE-like domain-containing protein [Ectothiorhodospira magna]|uniref:TOBE-like domain-containing protein n=1 Tax=Ectothiorhodospira magna TaxID=867345 RepID=A0A1H9BD81_9GAMM|nr:TOBE-like domain-containing protein [Ectothiorhodospira magna]
MVPRALAAADWVAVVRLALAAATPVLAAVIQGITVVGPTARLELKVAGGKDLIHAELPKTQLAPLGLSPGMKTWVRPVNSRVFVGSGASTAVEA